MRKTMGATTAIVLCWLVSTAGAASHRVISLPLHGTISLAGSHVLCGSGAYKVASAAPAARPRRAATSP